jgi:hypothetical protein
MEPIRDVLAVFFVHWKSNPHPVCSGYIERGAARPVWDV